MLRHPTRPRVWATSILVLVATACDSGDPSGPDLLELTGVYDYSFSISNTPLQVSCNGTGSITISQTGEQFTGSVNSNTSIVICNGPGGELSGVAGGQITGGTINGQAVTFNFPFFEAGCTSTGTATGTPVNSLSGDMTCTLDVSGQTVELTGTWQASR